MSYDFLMFKPAGDVWSPGDVSEETTSVIGTAAEIRAALSGLYPEIDWQDEHFGSLDGPDSWYEFRLSADDQKCFSIHTSFRTNERRLIPEICRALGLVAFDGQINSLIRGDP